MPYGDYPNPYSLRIDLQNEEMAHNRTRAKLERYRAFVAEKGLQTDPVVGHTACIGCWETPITESLPVIGWATTREGVTHAPDCIVKEAQDATNRPQA